MNTEPRTRFLQDKPRAGRHAELMASKEMQENLDFVFLQMVADTRTEPSMDHAAFNYYKIEGARDFIAMLKGFASTQAAPAPRKDFNLPGNVRE